MSKTIRIHSGERIHPQDLLPIGELQWILALGLFVSRYVRKGDTVLDVACGDGHLGRELVRAGARAVIGGDIDARGIRVAHERHGFSATSFVLLDAHTLPFRGDSFDLVLSIETLEHLAEPRRFVAECARVLKPGHIFVCSTPNIRGHSVATKVVLTANLLKAAIRGTSFLSKIFLNPYHVHEFSAQELKALVASHFLEVCLYGLRSRVPNPHWLARTPFLGVGMLEVQKLMLYVRRSLGLEKTMRLDDVGDWEDFVKAYPQPFILRGESEYCDTLIAVARKPA